MDIRSALDVLSDAGGTVPAALSALDPAVISGLFELYGQKLADQGRGQYIARLPGALGLTAVHGTAAPFASRLWNLPERYARCDCCSVRVYAAGQITASGLPRTRGPCWNIMMWNVLSQYRICTIRQPEAYEVCSFSIEMPSPREQDDRMLHFEVVAAGRCFGPTHRPSRADEERF